MPMTRLMTVTKSICSLNRSREFKELLRRSAPAKRDRLLDIGSGDGYWTSRFARYFGQTVGLEPDPHALSVARSLHGRDATFQQGFAEKLPFADKSFDCVVSVSCFEHFRDAQRALHECFRVLKPGGRLAISVDSLLPQNSREAFRSWHRKKYFVTDYLDESHLTSMFKQSGFCLANEPMTHLLNSRGSARIRELYLRNPLRWLPAFPFLYSMVLYFDHRRPNMPGQILVATAYKPLLPGNERAAERAVPSSEEASSPSYATLLPSH
jgi:ubiquinone/menaquinone biosynthesis C-methylase UbiE